MGPIDDLANRYVDEWAELSPIGATYFGIAGHDGATDDFSPAGFEAQAELTRRTLNDLDVIDPEHESEQVAKEAMQERLGLELARHDAGFTASEISVISSGLHALRGVFDVMPTEGEEAVANIAARLNDLPRALEQYKTTLRVEAEAGRVSARAQMLAVAEQCDAWTDPDRDDFYRGLAGRLTANGALAAELTRGADAATAATADFAEFLRGELAPRGRDKEAAGLERYELASQYFLGAKVDLQETYLWGFAELDRLEREMAVVSAAIAGPGASIDQAVAALDADPARNIPGKEAFRAWMQALADKAIAELNGTHFDIEPPARRIECCLTPTSDGGIYYTAPSEDFSRPGRTWYPTLGKTRFPLWREVSICYHEGVPGHHLHLTQRMRCADTLSTFQMTLGSVSAETEGWALYSERLMDELGFFTDPGRRLGFLDDQMLRTIRVIIDIGMHLELVIPADSPFHPGERWTPELATAFFAAYNGSPASMRESEIVRYLGWPGQAIGYKLGERAWRAGREQARARQGAGFDLKAWHMKALSQGAFGLGDLTEQLAGL